MKLTAILLMIAFVHVSASGVAQRVSISGEQLTLKQIFLEVKKQTGYVVFYNQKMLENTKPVSVSVKDVPLTELMALVLKDQPVEYIIKDKSIILSHRERLKRFDVRELRTPITGAVFSADGRVLQGASIRIKGTAKGTVTDENGRFTLDAAEGATLVISYTGFYNREVIIGTDKDINITLEAKENELDAVTVSTGYWTTDKRRSIGNITKVTAKDIERQPVTNPLMALQGRVPGLTISPFSGIPGGALSIQIRGQNSLRTWDKAGIEGNLPLYVIDGVPLDATPLDTRFNTTVPRGFDPLSTINPANIESIEVLKDADATAIYGSRGANGVILITTKNKKSVNGFNMEAGVYHGVGEIVRKVKTLGREQYLEMRREAIRNDGPDVQAIVDNPYSGKVSFRDLLLWDTTRYTDWQEVLMGEKANVTDAQVSFSLGNGQSAFRFNGGYHHETLIYPGDFGYKRYNADISYNYRSADQRLNVSFTGGYGNNLHNLYNSALASNVLTAAPTSPKLYNEDGSLNWEVIPAGLLSAGNASFINPMSYLRTSHNVNTNMLKGNLVASYEVLPGLALRTTMGYARLDGNETTLIPIASKNPYNRFDQTGTRYEMTNNRKSWTIDPQATYDKAFGKHSLNTLLGGSFQEVNGENSSISADGYTSDAAIGSIAGALRISGTRSSDEYRYASIYGRIGYNYADKYFVNVTGRRDGSSKFGPGKRFGTFGSVGAAWIFTEEPFMTGAGSIVSFGKLRASYGSTGNDQLNASQYLKRYTIGTVQYAGLVALTPTALFNPDLKWETTRKLELGLELGLLKDRIRVEAAWYRNRSSNQLINYVLPFTTGFPDVITNFNALLENSGTEIIMTTRNIDGSTFRWTTSINLSLPKNKLVKFDGIENTAYNTLYKVGAPLSIKSAYNYIGVDPQTGLYSFADLNGDGETNYLDWGFFEAPRIYYNGGISNTFSYQGIELSFLFQVSSSRTRTGLFTNTPGTSNQHVSGMNRWQKPGDIAEVQRFSTSYNTSGLPNSAFIMYTQSSGMYGDLWFARLKTLSLSYAIPAPLLKKAHMQGATIYLQGYNLLTFTDYRGWDPETLQSVPPSRFISAGLNIKL